MYCATLHCSWSAFRCKQQQSVRGFRCDRHCRLHCHRKCFPYSHSSRGSSFRRQEAQDHSMSRYVIPDQVRQQLQQQLQLLLQLLQQLQQNQQQHQQKQEQRLVGFLSLQPMFQPLQMLPPRSRCQLLKSIGFIQNYRSCLPPWESGWTLSDVTLRGCSFWSCGVSSARVTRAAGTCGPCCLSGLRAAVWNESASGGASSSAATTSAGCRVTRNTTTSSALSMRESALLRNGGNAQGKR